MGNKSGGSSNKKHKKQKKLSVDVEQEVRLQIERLRAQLDKQSKQREIEYDQQIEVMHQERFDGCEKLSQEKIKTLYIKCHSLKVRLGQTIASCLFYLSTQLSSTTLIAGYHNFCYILKTKENSLQFAEFEELNGLRKVVEIYELELRKAIFKDMSCIYDRILPRAVLEHVVKLFYMSDQCEDDTVTKIMNVLQFVYDLTGTQHLENINSNLTILLKDIAS
ncbi:hypothetical protein ABK040_014277 [Willaertia magna]